MFNFIQTLSPFFLYGFLGALLIGEILLLVLIVSLFIQNKRLKKKLHLFFSGKEGKDLEKVLIDQLHETKALDQEIQELFEISNQLRDLGMRSVHKTALLRFNPFKEVGGNQSFCIAFLDGKNSGCVLSSLHTREGTRVYAKPVISGREGAFPFTEEEKSTITQAISGKSSVL
ncbi:MAG: DUF4446 family protein [Candidatus Moranbacteria bacterium]|nr:DUF4446 family protein [Candidatus Moranbacteria bacterium]OIQ04314.1 MAG: hypothetical protein AUK58_01050 [Candidatus Moranbacteria bacterium CG2_30_41_165]PIP25517.1 MAG: hypothetical protein COX32_02905 [Candidatus Moranbacteria bacterium CG23_combo_of_CG06-09_8_20_14_all_41_28]PIV85952.1 MAG: hypothetical protein COW50_04275 [Candidatus Moranbacteria bacterium CG17_big_fil_post_rev_8_21_14_2_50_41_107]PIW93746.1 MAG: hypothetical protein COZ86_04725 [Candidatus Moranbacteria bacterium C